jgi:hypothetical protein
MKFFSLLPLLGLAAAMPVNEKRDVVIQDVVVTEYVTTTIWIDPADPTPAAFFEQASSSASASSSSAAPSTTTTPPPAAPTTTPPAAAPTAPPAAPASSGTIMSGTGDLTFYDVGMGIGSCGMPQASPSDMVVALNTANMDSGYSGNPNDNPLCGKSITITYNGVSATGILYDSCPTCNEGDVDLSTGFFDHFGTQAQGRLIGATWIVT